MPPPILTRREPIADELACTREFIDTIAANIDSSKRNVLGSFAPTAVAWERDDRTRALRIVGRRLSLRLESHIPGGDVNRYQERFCDLDRL